MQSPSTTDWSNEILARLGTVAWFDWTALAVVCGFLVLGLAKGLRWQLSRLAGLLAAYGVAILAAETVTATLPGMLVGAPPSAMALHTVQIVLFVAVIVVLGIAFQVVRRFVIPSEPAFAGRVIAALVGVVSGALWTLALLTASQLVLDGWSVAAAARSSKSAVYGSRALRFASEELLPEGLAHGAAAWGALLDENAATSSRPRSEQDAPAPGAGSDRTLVPRESRD
jgi:uncharacterized membrane protein required for colicin V production